MMTGNKTYTSKWWAMAIPDTWDIEETRDGVTFRVPGRGSIVINAMKKQEGCVTENDLRRYSKQFRDSDWTESQEDWGELRGIKLLSSGRECTERFYLACGDLMLVVRHEPGAQDVSMESADVVSILKRIRVLR